jgi:apolipoprotein N-acyltransferase
MKLEFKNGNLWKLTLWYMTAGVLLGSAFLHPALWWSALLGVALFVCAINNSTSWRQLLTLSFLAGFIQFAIVCRWMWYVHPLTGFEIAPNMSLISVGLSWFLTAFAIGGGKVFFAALLFKYKDAKWIYWSIPFFWLVSDVVGAFLFTLLSYGPGTFLNANFSFGWVGYLLAEQAFLLPLAAIGGVFLLTLLYVYIALWLLRIVQKKGKYRWFVASGLVLLLFFTGELPVGERVHDESLAVAAIETNTKTLLGVVGQDYALYRDELMQKVQDAVAGGANYIILPEGADLTKAFVDPENMLQFLANSVKQEIVLVDSGWHYGTDETSYVRARIYDTHAMEIYEVDKQYLVPQGEFMPYLFIGIMGLLGFSEGVEQYQGKFNYVPGILTESLDLPTYIPGVLFCFESINPLGVRKLAQYRDMPFVAHPVSHAWFHEPTVLWYQLDQMLSVNARFGGVTVFQAANRYKAKRY